MTVIAAAFVVGGTSVGLVRWWRVHHGATG
jgi:hypothetical protein